MIILHYYFCEIMNKKSTYYLLPSLLVFTQVTFYLFLSPMNAVYPKLNHDFHYLSMTLILKISYAYLTMSPLSTRIIIHSSVLLLLWNYKQTNWYISFFCLECCFYSRDFHFFFPIKGCHLVDAEVWLMLFSHALHLKSCMPT